jgi:hypothetical protein
MFIRRLELMSDSEAVLQNLNNILEQTVWLPQNQIGLNHRPDATDPWKDGVGSLYDRVNNKFISNESDYSVWNKSLAVSYVKSQIELLSQSENFSPGRIRFMRLLPKTGLSVHKDAEVRYHLVLKTNSKAYVCRKTIDTDIDISCLPESATCYHMPQDNHWYCVDTRQVHWVYNGGDTERIHLVVCGP